MDNVNCKKWDEQLSKNGNNIAKNKDSVIPSKTEVLRLFKKLELPHNIINHVQAVARKAIKMSHNIKTIPINLKIVKIGALLHDIGRLKSHNFDHSELGGEIIRNLGYSEKLARIAETHILGGLTKEEAIELGLTPKDYMPHSIEEKIVCLADKYHIGTKQVSINIRFQKWFQKWGETELLLKSKKRVEDIELHIFKIMYH